MTFHEDWYSAEQLTRVCLFAAAVQARGVNGRFVELGCWTGKSTLAIAAAIAPERLTVVDHFRGNPEAPYTVTLARERDIEAEFRVNLTASGLTNVDLRVLEWRDWAQLHLDARFAFVHLDAGHDRESVHDQVRFFLPRMVPGGLLCGDDYAAWPGVQQGLRAAGLEVEHEGNLWWSHR